MVACPLEGLVRQRLKQIGTHHGKAVKPAWKDIINDLHLSRDVLQDRANRFIHPSDSD